MKSILSRIIGILAIAGLFLGLAHTPTIAEIAEPYSADIPEETTQDAWNVEYVGQIGGVTRAVAIQGSYAYIDVGPRLVILDISNPASPIMVGRTQPVPDGIGDVAVSGNLVYLSGTTLRVVDVSDPSDPYEVGSSPSYWGGGLAISGSYAYVAAGSAGLRVFDISDPSKPYEVGSYTSAASDVAVSGGYAYVAGSNAGLRVVNITNPANPYEVGFLDTEGSNTEIVVSGAYAYIAADYAGLLVVDISNPTNPYQVGSYKTPDEALCVTVSGYYAYVGAGNAGLRVINIYNPANPYEVSSYDYGTNSHAIGIAVSGNYTYVANGSAGLWIVNTTNPAYPYKVSSYNTIGGASEVKILGGNAYTVNPENGLRVISILNPYNPYQLSYYDSYSWYSQSVAVLENYAYLADSSGLRVINISNPAHPYQVGFYDTPGLAVDVVISGGYAYVVHSNYVTGDYGLLVLNVTNSAYPYQVGFFNTPTSSGAVAISNGFLYLVSDYSLRILNISNPAYPYEVGICEIPGSPESVAVSGSYAYVTSSGELYVVDVSSPTNPHNIGIFETPGNAMSVAVSGDYAFVADYWDGLMVVNISTSTLPYEVGFYQLSGAQGVAISGGYIYVASRDEGLFILRFHYTISGRITDSGGIPLAGATVTADPGYGAVTDGFGYYKISNVPAGSYTITPSLSGYAFSPALRTIKVPPDAVGQDFIGTALRIEGFEVNQVLGHQKDGEQNYVAGKATALRVFLNAPVQTSPATQKITVLRDGAAITTLYPQPEIYPTDELTFLCKDTSDCDNWQAGSYTFNVIVNGVVLQHGPFAIVESRPLRILAVPVKIKVDGEVLLPDESWKTAHEFLEKVYPIPSSGVDWVKTPVLDATELDLTNEDDQIDLIKRLDNRQPLLCGFPSRPPCYDQIIGFIADVEICNESGCLGGWTTVSSISVVMTKDDMQAIVTHEIGHNYGLGDEYDNMCGFFECDVNPPPLIYCGWDGKSEECTNDYFCLDSEAILWRGTGTGSAVLGSQDHPYDVTKTESLGDKMSFMGSGETMDNYWITPDIYHHLFGELVSENTAFSFLTETGKVIQASGLIGQDGTVELMPWLAITTTLPTMITGTYSIDAVDAANQVLASQGFEVSYLMLSDPPQDMHSAPFQVTLPFPEGTAAFQIKQGNAVLSQVAVSEHAPLVNVIYPNGWVNWGTTGEVTITWSGSDADGDTLFYTVLYTPDGYDWVTLNANITSTQTTVALDEIPGGAQARIQVIATDGVNTSVDLSDSIFNVGNKPPSAYILSPSSQTTIPNGTSFYLRGYVYDLEDGSQYLGSPDEPALTWRSSKDGYLGAGPLVLANLSHGYHMITFTVADSQGAQSTAVISVYVGSLLYLPYCQK